MLYAPCAWYTFSALCFRRRCKAQSGLQEPGAADSDFEMSGDLQKQQSFDPLQVPSSPDVSEASSATSRINSSLGIGTGAPSKAFPLNGCEAIADGRCRICTP